MLNNKFAGLASILIILTIASVIVSTLLDGWVLSIMWGWFIVPIFDLPRLSFVAAVGVSLVVGALIHQSTNTDGKDLSDKIGALILRIVFAPLFSLFVGWIVHSCL